MSYGYTRRRSYLGDHTDSERRVCVTGHADLTIFINLLTLGNIHAGKNQLEVLAVYHQLFGPFNLGASLHSEPEVNIPQSPFYFLLTGGQTLPREKDPTAFLSHFFCFLLPG